ncbi:hypothetical protein BKH41_06935 [Helicobacter sp. 12S02232-10]|uniref:glycosyltransferase n=1 Tax=Helicobacter sp. 12S02232-10 TaxID=1476197 RepID=UPI000BA5725B|nr:glycosyltransferase [Helicobacter sp. 12S02232-10]PAF47626.1 hypothetical protein BKH41_06935 [Helicobacter sp. 12S02232-10]
MIDLSVIVPIYNVQNYLRQCLDSLIKQKLQNMQILCINDGSTDGSLDIISEYAKIDCRIELINKANSGYGHSCNVGIKKALGQYIAILEPDDFIDPGMYEALLKVAGENDSDIVKCAYYDYFDSMGSKASHFKMARWNQAIKPPKKVFEIKDCPLFLFHHPSIWAGIYKREFLLNHQIEFVEAKGASWVDNPFSVQTLCMAKKISYIEKAYYFYRQSNPNASSNLKDFKIPLERMHDINAFLNTHKESRAEILTPILKKYIRYLLLSIYVGKNQRIPIDTIKFEVHSLINQIIKDFKMSQMLKIQFLLLRFVPIDIIYYPYALLKWAKYKFLV